MGWCHEFGAEIVEGCAHAMVAREGGCTCQECGAVCRGRFPGCARVWARASSAGGDSAPAARSHATSASWAAAAARPAGFRHSLAGSESAGQTPGGSRGDDPGTDIETLKEQVRQLTLLTERLAGRLDAVLTPSASPARPPARRPAPAQVPPPAAAAPAKKPPARPAPGAWPPDALDNLVARTEWKQMKRRVRTTPRPLPQ